MRRFWRGERCDPTPAPPASAEVRYVGIAGDDSPSIIHGTVVATELREVEPVKLVALKVRSTTEQNSVKVDAYCTFLVPAADAPKYVVGGRVEVRVSPLGVA